MLQLALVRIVYMVIDAVWSLYAEDGVWGSPKLYDTVAPGVTKIRTAWLASYIEVVWAS